MDIALIPVKGRVSTGSLTAKMEKAGAKPGLE